MTQLFHPVQRPTTSIWRLKSHSRCKIHFHALQLQDLCLIKDIETRNGSQICKTIMLCQRVTGHPPTATCAKTVWAILRCHYHKSCSNTRARTTSLPLNSSSYRDRCRLLRTSCSWMAKQKTTASTVFPKQPQPRAWSPLIQSRLVVFQCLFRLSRR